MHKHYLQNAPRGVTGIQLDNGDEAVYLDGECIACCDIGDRDDAVVGTGQRIAGKMGVPFQLLSLPVPEDEEWSWNDITDSLGWGKPLTIPRRMLRPVMECFIRHITAEDNLVLGGLAFRYEDSEWVINTSAGYLIRLDAFSNTLLRLKRAGISRTTRAFIFCAMRQADISMIHFSSAGDAVDGAPLFDW